MKKFELMTNSFYGGKEVKMMKKTLMVLMIAFAAVFAMNVPAVQAVPMLTLSDGSTTVIITDGGVGDSNPLAGAITYIGPVGLNWFLNVSTGVTKPVLGSATSPQMDLNSIDLSAGAGTLTIKFSDAGFGPFSGVLKTDAGGTAAGTVMFDTLVNGSSIGTIGPLGPGAFAGSSSGFASSLSSLELDATIHHTKGGSTSFDQFVTQVPEPGMLLLLGSGIIALAGFKRSVRK